MAVAVIAVVIGASSGSTAQDARATSVLVGGVEIEGVAAASSTGEPREPRYVLRNPTEERRVVELLSLVSLDAVARHPLTLTSPRRVELAPGATEEISIAFTGEPVQSGRGLPHHRFELLVRVGTDRARAIASTAYVCRIPRRDHLH